MPLADGLMLEAQLFWELVASEDALRLMKAYVETGQNTEQLPTDNPPAA
jgi:hypothetical protein